MSKRAKVTALLLAVVVLAIAIAMKLSAHPPVAEIHPTSYEEVGRFENAVGLHAYDVVPAADDSSLIQASSEWRVLNPSPGSAEAFFYETAAEAEEAMAFDKGQNSDPAAGDRSERELLAHYTRSSGGVDALLGGNATTDVKVLRDYKK